MRGKGVFEEFFRLKRFKEIGLKRAIRTERESERIRNFKDGDLWEAREYNI